MNSESRGPQVIIPDKADRSKFADVLRAVQLDDPAMVQRVARSFIDVVLRSFGDDVRLHLVAVAPTERETKRRTEICIEWFRVMVGDMHFPVIKALDLLPQALRAELEGLPFKPRAEGGWSATADSIAMVPDGELYNDASKTRE